MNAASPTGYSVGAPLRVARTWSCSGGSGRRADRGPILGDRARRPALTCPARSKKHTYERWQRGAAGPARKETRRIFRPGGPCRFASVPPKERQRPIDKNYRLISYKASDLLMAAAR